MIANLIFSFFNEEMVFNCRPNHQSDFKGIFWFFFFINLVGNREYNFKYCFFFLQISDALNWYKYVKAAVDRCKYNLKVYCCYWQ